MEELEAAAGERNPVSHEEDDTSRVAVEEEEEEGAQSAAGSAYNPENPYHVSANFVNNTVYDKQVSRAGAFLIKMHILSPGATLKAALGIEVSLFCQHFQMTSSKCQPC